MRTLITTVAFGLASLGVLAMLVHPSIGLLYDRPGVAFGFGLIGLGVCLEVRKRSTSAQASAE